MNVDFNSYTDFKTVRNDLYLYRTPDWLLKFPVFFRRMILRPSRIIKNAYPLTLTIKENSPLVYQFKENPEQ